MAKEKEITLDQLEELDCVSVIRCKDCSNGSKRRGGHIECALDEQLWNPDDYCSYGEKE